MFTIHLNRRNIQLTCCLPIHDLIWDWNVKEGRWSKSS